MINPGYHEHRLVKVPVELAQLLLESRGLVNVVKPRDVTFARALTTASALFGDDWRDFADGHPDRKDIGAQQANAAVSLICGEGTGALAHLLAAHEAAPDSAEVLFNVAAVMARVGMPNEALAVLAELDRRGKKPEIALGMDSEAAVAYIRGWCEMVLGRLDDARTHLRKAAEHEPYISEARHTLAIVESTADNPEEARKQFYLGVWRRQPQPQNVMVCGGAKDSAGNKVPDKDWQRADPARSDTVRIAPEEILDLSNGKFGVLPQFNHPDNVDEARALVMKLQPVIERRMRELYSETELGRLTTAAHKHPDEAERVYCDRITQIIDSLDRVHPVVHSLSDEVSKAWTELREHSGRVHDDTMKKRTELLRSLGGRPDAIAAIEAGTRELANSAVNQLRPYVQGYEMAMRRYHRIWHHYATGLAANIGEPTWLKKNVRAIQLATEGHWSSILGHAVATYNQTLFCKPQQANVDDIASPEQTDVDGCPSNLKGHGAKLELGFLDDFKLSIKFSCEKTTLEVSKKIIGTPKLFPIEASASGFIQLDMERKGDVTVFIGPSAKLGVQGPSGTGFGVTAKEGVYIKADAKGVKDIGTKISVESYEKVGPDGSLIFTQKAFDDITFSFMPAPPTPTGGPHLRTFGVP